MKPSDAVRDRMAERERHAKATARRKRLEAEYEARLVKRDRELQSRLRTQFFARQEAV